MTTVTDILPISGSRIEAIDRDSNLRISKSLALFDTIRIPYPRHVETQSKIDYVHRLGIETPGPKKGLRILGESGQGKTTCAHDYMRLCQAEEGDALPVFSTDGNEDSCPKSKRVIYVALENGTTARGLMVSILQSLGDPFWNRGSEALLRSRALDIIRNRRIELIIIDEVQHLNSRGSSGFDVTDTLKNFLDKGVAPVVFMGTLEARPLFERNLQLNGRLLPPGDLQVLTTSVDDQKLLRGFCRQLDIQIVEKGLLPKRSNLEDPKILASLYEVSGGVIGRVVRLTHAALESALRRGADWIETYDLALAVDRWAIPQGFVKRNPFAST